MKRLSPRSPRRQTKVTFSVNQRPRSGRKIDKKVLDSTSHRLSEPANKFEKIQASMSLSAESGTFAINFFKKNPHLKDESRPEEKILKYDQILSSDNLDPSERLKILIQKKMVVNLVHGQCSPEYLKSVASIGSYYIANHRISSAIRHLEEALEFESLVSITIEESMKIRMELAEAYLALPCAKKSELVRNTNKAYNTIKPYLDIISEDPKTNYVKSHILGKIAFRKNDFDESINKYNDAFTFLDDVNNGRVTPQTANLYFEIGKVYSKQDLSKTAGNYYQKAYDIFVGLNMLNQASVIEPLLPTGEEVDIIYDSEKNIEAIEVQPIQNYQNDSSVQSQSSIFNNNNNETNDTNDEESDTMKLFFQNSITSKYDVQVDVKNKNSRNDENDNDGNSENKNSNVEISYLHFNKDEASHEYDDDKSESRSEVKKLNVEIDIGNDSTNNDQYENESEGGESSLVESGNESFNSLTRKSRTQDDYQVEIEEEEEDK